MGVPKVIFNELVGFLKAKSKLTLRTGSSINLFTEKGKGKPRPRVLLSPKTSVLCSKLAARLVARVQASAQLCVFLLEIVDESLKLIQLLQLPNPGTTCRFSLLKSFC